MTKLSNEAAAFRIARAEDSLLVKMANGAQGSAQDLSPRDGIYTWFALLNLERAGLVWRAFDYENWRTLHYWKITGCGRMRAGVPGQCAPAR